MKSTTITIPQLPRRTWLAHAIVAMLAASALTVAQHAQARIFVSVNIAPPMLPVYEQPAMPGAGYLWTPGYWGYGDGGYYWIPGTWVMAPYSGALWTPGYWGWNNNAYIYNQGYWGLHVGYYGGINYGFGYGGIGYFGGYWGHGHFFYNQAYNQFGGVHITNVYNRTEINAGGENHYSYNGPGGADHRATLQEQTYSHERHRGPVGDQVRQRELASHNESLRASVNHGTPPIMATPRAGAFEHADGNAHAAAETAHAEQNRANETHAAQSGPAAERGHTSGRSQQAQSHHAAVRPTHVAHTAAAHNHAPRHAVAQRHSAHVQQHARTASHAPHAQAHHQQASTHHAQASHAQAPHAQTSHAQAPHAQASHGQPHSSGGSKPKGHSPGH
jgi:hypothetical protein